MKLLVVPKTKEQEYKKYVEELQNGHCDAYRPDVLVEIDGHFVGLFPLNGKYQWHSGKIAKNKDYLEDPNELEDSNNLKGKDSKQLEDLERVETYNTANEANCQCMW